MMQEPQPDDIGVAVRLCRATLEPLADGDWSIRAGDLEWSARQTLEHMVGVLDFYALHLAARAPQHLPLRYALDPGLSIRDLLTSVEARAAVLAAVIAAAPPTARAWHPAGRADPAGFAAMACDELLMHTQDIADGFGRLVQPPPELCRRVLARLFPWAPGRADPWQALRWANGRVALPDCARLGRDWSWWCAPLSEWDGAIKRVAVP